MKLTKHRVGVAVLACLGLAAVMLGLRSCRKDAFRGAETDRTIPPPAAPLKSTPSSVSAKAGDAVSSSPEMPVIASGSRGMLSLSFVFGAQDQLSLRAREEVVNASPRPLRRIEGQRGVYHRIVDGSGQILFENLVPDPRTVHWDTTDDGKTLRGGVVTLADQPLVLSLPAGVKGTLEVYLLRDENWARATLDKHGKLAGTFVVQ